MDRINARLVPDDHAVITPGAAGAGMLLNGLGCAHRPLSLTPPFCASKPRARWLREGLEAERCNRFTRGRTLDEAQAYGGDLLVQELALAICAHAGIALRGTHRDTTSVSRRGASGPERAEHAITSTHGSSSEHRPDLKPAVLDRMVSHDGGGPGVSQRWEGHPSDRELFQARAQAWRAAFQPAPSPRSLLADAPRSPADNAPHLRALGCFTRLPHPIGPVSPVSTPALTWETGPPRDEPTRAQRRERCHDGMAQRWLVVPSPAARARAETTVHQARPGADETSATQLLPLHANRLPTPAAAHGALGTWAKGGQDHQVDARRLTAHQREAGQGRPPPQTPLQAVAWQIDAHVRPADAALRRQQQG